MTTSHYLYCSSNDAGIDDDDDDNADDESIISANNHSIKNIFVCLDGPPGIGKTLISDIVTDYSYYLDEMLTRAEVRSINENMMFVEYTTLLCNMNTKYKTVSRRSIIRNNESEESQILINRSIFSSFIYSIFFKYRGHKINFENFKNFIDNDIFNSPNITKMNQQWLHVLNSHTAYLANTPYRLLWILPQSSKLMFDSLMTTQFYCIYRNRIILKNYCENILYLYCRFAKTTNFGDILNVTHRITRTDVENFYKNMDHYQQF